MPAGDADCPVRRAMSVLGSKWALLVVRRTVHGEMPVRVVYELTPLGREIAPVVEALGIWGERLASARVARRRAHAGHVR